ncbi:MAG TPA: cytochrome c family protein [Caulobacteraceae bacterium]|jgi:cytochrome c
MSFSATTARLSIITAAALALAACGRPSSNTTNAPAETTAPQATVGAPAEPTDAQKKALIAELPPAYESADLSNGEAKYAVCRACHTLKQGGEDMTGPNLWGIFGRKAGSKPGFSYSDGMKKAGWTWDAPRLDTWISNPHAEIPDTKMTFIGLPNVADRHDVIAFLKVETSPPPKS